MTAITFILITVLVGAAIHQAHKFGYDKGYHEGYEDGEYEGYRCGLKDSNMQFQNMCDEIIRKKTAASE